VAHEIRPHADEWDEAGEVPWDLHRKAAELGLFGFGIADVYGGRGFDGCFKRAAAGEEPGRLDFQGPSLPYSGRFDLYDMLLPERAAIRVC